MYLFKRNLFLPQSGCSIYLLSFLLLNCTLLWLQQSCRLCSQLPQEEGPGTHARPDKNRNEASRKILFMKLVKYLLLQQVHEYQDLN